MTSSPRWYARVTANPRAPFQIPESRRGCPREAVCRDLTFPAPSRRQDEHGEECDGSEELAAAKAILDEVEPLIEDN